MKELGTRDFIVFGRNYKAHVTRVISDSRLKITHAIHTDPLDSVRDEEGYYSFKIAPHVDQTAVYDEVYHYLNKNECITIFPEGGSHDRSEMLPLKGICCIKYHCIDLHAYIVYYIAGFAVMALGAAAANPNLDIKIVPVGEILKKTHAQFTDNLTYSPH